MQETGLNRDSTLDKYYTKPQVAVHYIQQTNALFPLSQFDMIIEPAAGNGSFSTNLSKFYNGNIVSYDIEPEHSTIRKQDFLNLSRDTTEDFKDKNTLVISNVPFGRQSCLAKKFIRQSCEFASVVAFILPKSFKKDSFQKVFPLAWHLVFQEDVADKSFTVNSLDHNVPCVFQIWAKQNRNRQELEKVYPVEFEYVKQQEPHDIVYRRVGVYAGKATKYNVAINVSAQSHYFICIKDKTKTEKLLLDLNNYKWKFGNHVGPKSIAKTELTPILNKIIREC